MNPLILDQAARNLKAKPKAKTRRNTASFSFEGKPYTIEWDGPGDDADIQKMVGGVIGRLQRESMGYTQSDGDRFIPEGTKPNTGQAPKPLPMGKPAKKQPAALQPSRPTSYLDLVAPPGLAGLAGTVIGSMKGGVAASTGEFASDLDKLDKTLGSRGNIVPSKAISQMLAGADPQLQRIIQIAAETWEPRQMISLAQTLASEVSTKLSTGDVSPEIGKIGADFKKNPLATAVMFLAGVDEDLKARLIAGDPSAMEQLVGNVLGGMSQAAGESAFGALMAGRRGAAAAAKAVKGAKAVTKAEQTDAIVRAMGTLRGHPEPPFDTQAINVEFRPNTRKGELSPNQRAGMEAVGSTGDFMTDAQRTIDTVAAPTMGDIENAGGVGFTLMKSSGGPQINFNAQVRRGGPLAVKLSRDIDQGVRLPLTPEQSRQLAALEDLPGGEGYRAVEAWWDAPEQSGVRTQIVNELNRQRAIGDRMEALYKAAADGRISAEEYKAGIKAALAELDPKATFGTNPAKALDPPATTGSVLDEVLPDANRAKEPWEMAENDWRNAMLDAGMDEAQASAAAVRMATFAQGVATRVVDPYKRFEFIREAADIMDPSGKLTQIILNDKEKALSITTLDPKLPTEVNRTFAQRVQDRVRQMFDGKVDTNDAGNRTMLARVLAHDAAHEIATNPTNNALGWYDRKIAEAMKWISKRFPEVAENESARGAYTFILAVTSNGQKVADNFKLADQVYAAFRKTGKMPIIGRGKPAKAMKEAFKFWNDNVKPGEDATTFLKFLNTDFTVAEARAMGIKVSGEWADQMVSGGHAIGPKIGGGFYRNLSGYFDSLTSDRWFQRTWGRMTGALVDDRPARETALLNDFRARVAEATDEDLAKYGFTREDLVDDDALADLADVVHAAYAKQGPNGKTYTDRSPFNQSAKRLDQYYTDTADQPSAMDRAHQRQVVAEAIRLLKDEYDIDISTADLQALVWYPEQRAWGAGANAVDYAGAAKDTYGKLRNPVQETPLTQQGYKLGSLSVKDRLAEQRSRVLGGLRRSLYSRVGRGSNAGRTPLPSAYSRRSHKSRSPVLVDGTQAKITGTFSMSQTWKNAISTIVRPNGDRAIPTPPMHQLSDAADFHRLISSAVESLGEDGVTVHVYTPEEYAQMRVFIADDGSAGFAIKPDGDIVSVFRHADSQYPGLTPSMMQLAIDLGGKKLDAFDTAKTRLPDLYSRTGFREVARLPFDPAQAPKGWNPDVHGTPDVVFMVHDPSFHGKRVTADYADSYGDALRLQDEALVKHPDPTLKQNIDGEVVATYDPKTSVAALIDGKATPASAIEEFFHHSHKVLMDDPEAGDILRRHYGEYDVESNREGLERAARHFLRYVQSGKAPNAELRGVFQQMAAWMKEMWSNVTQGRIPREVRELFESLDRAGAAEPNVQRMAKDWDAKYSQSTPASTPARAVETPEAAGAAVEPSAQTVTPDAPKPDVPPPSTPTSARQADINADREALGKAGFSTDDVRKWSELEEKANPNAIPREADGSYKAGAWTDQETVNATARLRQLKSELEEARAKGDTDTLVTLEDEFDALTEAMYRSGTEQGRALAARRYTMDVDMSVDGMRARYKARAAKNGTKVDPKRLKELEDIADAYAKLQGQIDSGELVKSRKRSAGPAKTKDELSAELSKMWEEFNAKVDLDTDTVPLASGFTSERMLMIGKMAVKAVELGVATVDELVEAVVKQFRDRGLDAPDRETILNAWRTERDSSRRTVSEEVKAARAARAKLESEMRAELDAPNRAKKQADAEARKAEAAAKRAEERAAAAAERQRKVEASQKARADEKARARAERAAADAEVKALREEQERILGERKAWDKRNTERQRELERLNSRIAELEQSIEAGTGMGPKSRKPSKADADIERLRARQTMLQARARAVYNSTQPRKLADTAVGLLNIPRTVKASIDISAPGRQGWILGIANPKAAYKAFGDQMRALMTEEGAVIAQNAIMDRPNVARYKAADLYLAPVDGSLNAKEEAFLGSEMFSRWKRNNPVRASDRAYAAYLNRLRADVFDNMANALGPNATDEQLREIARYINVASGRGDIGGKGASDAGKSVSRAMPALALGLWSPRNLASRIQFVAGMPMWQAAKVPGARKLIAKEYAKTIIATGSVIGLAKLGLESTGQGSVSGDITSSDFGKVRAGDTRIDMMAGVQQPLVLIGRLLTGKSTSPVSGKVTNIKQPKFGQPGPKELISRFGWSKANPVFGSMAEIYTGEDFVGNEVGTGEALANVVVPLSVKEIYDALTEEGIDKQDALVLLNVFGISTSRFKDKEKPTN